MAVVELKSSLAQFVAFAQPLKADEKSEAQNFSGSLLPRADLLWPTACSGRMMTELRKARRIERQSGKRKLFPVCLVDFKRCAT